MDVLPLGEHSCPFSREALMQRGEQPFPSREKAIAPIGTIHTRSGSTEETGGGEYGRWDLHTGRWRSDRHAPLAEQARVLLPITHPQVPQR